jgi:hypothetical protein
MLRVCSKETELGRAEIARQRSRISGAKSSAKKEVFRGWGEPTGDHERLTGKQSSSIKVRILFISFRSEL